MTAPVNKMRPIHPGEILREEFAVTRESTHELAICLSCKRSRLIRILNLEEDIDRPIAERLSEHFGTSLEFWLNLQRSYDQRMSEETLKTTLRSAGFTRGTFEIVEPKKEIE